VFKHDLFIKGFIPSHIYCHFAIMGNDIMRENIAIIVLLLCLFFVACIAPDLYNPTYTN